MKNGLYIIATPIGNLSDMSPRATESLRQADVIACEDTRMAKKLLSLLGIGINKQFITLHDHNEDEHAQKLIDLINNDGLSVALISDAGSPLISDPGYKLIRRCREQNVYVTTIPGCCALICALQLSGLPTNRFMFVGFLPNKDKARLDLFNKFKDVEATLVFYETASRILKTLIAAHDVFGNREMSVAREITKLYEECQTGNAEELIKHFTENEPRGEMVFMVAPGETKELAEAEIKEKLRKEMQDNSLKTAVKNLVERYKLNKNEIYEMALKIRDEK